MNKELSDFAARLRGGILSEGRVIRGPDLKIENGGSCNSPLRGLPIREFESLALELFALQFKYNAAYRKLCESRRLTPKMVQAWTLIPAVPTAAFKELELTCLPPNKRAAVFHSSGTTGQKPGRHFHCAESLKIYESSLLPWFIENVLPDLRFTIYDLRSSENPDIGLGKSTTGNSAPARARDGNRCRQSAIFLTPPPEQAPHSSLVHMFEVVRSCACESADRSFFGTVAADSSWTLDLEAVLVALNSSLVTRHSSLILGTAFSFVHLLDYMAENNLRFDLPAGSRVMETGGYKNRSRSMPKTELHALITERLGVPPENIICEYGMSELSSQAYASDIHHRLFQFPPWARVQIISPETGREVAEGETGLIRVFDLANVFSVMAIQTEDLGIRREDGFELIGRVASAEARGCSLMMNEPLAPSLSPPGGERVAEGRVRG